MRLLEVDKHVLDELLAGRSVTKHRQLGSRSVAAAFPPVVLKKPTRAPCVLCGRAPGAPGGTCRVVIKGSADEEAILCTSSKTFLLKYVETSNAQLLVAPEVRELPLGRPGLCWVRPSRAPWLLHTMMHRCISFHFPHKGMLLLRMHTGCATQRPLLCGFLRSLLWLQDASSMDADDMTGKRGAGLHAWRRVSVRANLPCPAQVWLFCLQDAQHALCMQTARPSALALALACRRSTNRWAYRQGTCALLWPCHALCTHALSQHTTLSLRALHPACAVWQGRQAATRGGDCYSGCAPGGERGAHDLFKAPSLHM